MQELKFIFLFRKVSDTYQANSDKYEFEDRLQIKWNFEEVKEQGAGASEYHRDTTQYPVGTTE